MIATAIKLQEASKDAVHDEMIMEIVKHIVSIRDVVDDESFIKEMYNYSAMLSAMTTTLVTHALLTESQIDEMMSSINEFDKLGKDIINGN